MPTQAESQNRREHEPLPHQPEDETIIEDVEELRPGDLLERTTPDGRPVQDVYIGNTISNEKETAMFARIEDGQARISSKPIHVAEAMHRGEEQYDTLHEAFKRIVDATVSAEGLTGSEAERVRANIQERAPQLIREILGQPDLDEALIESVRQEITQPESGEPGNLLTLLRAIGKEETALETHVEDDKQQTEMGARLTSLERDLYTQIEPIATPETRAWLDQFTTGYTTIESHPLADEGLEAVEDRIKEINKQIEKEDGDVWIVLIPEKHTLEALRFNLEQAERIDELTSELNTIVEGIDTITSLEDTTSTWRHLGKRLAQAETFASNLELSMKQQEAPEDQRDRIDAIQEQIDDLIEHYEILEDRQLEQVLEVPEAEESLNTALYTSLSEMAKLGYRDEVTRVANRFLEQGTDPKTEQTIERILHELESGELSPTQQHGFRIT